MNKLCTNNNLRRPVFKVSKIATEKSLKKTKKFTTYGYLNRVLYYSYHN